MKSTWKTVKSPVNPALRAAARGIVFLLFAAHQSWAWSTCLCDHCAVLNETATHCMHHRPAVDKRNHKDHDHSSASMHHAQMWHEIVGSQPSGFCMGAGAAIVCCKAPSREDSVCANAQGREPLTVKHSQPVGNAHNMTTPTKGVIDPSRPLPIYLSLSCLLI